MVAHPRQSFSHNTKLLQGNTFFPKTNEFRHPQVQRVTTSILTQVPLDTLKEIHTNFVRQTAWINKNYIASMSKSPQLTKIIYEIQNDPATKIVSTMISRQRNPNKALYYMLMSLISDNVQKWNIQHI